MKESNIKQFYEDMRNPKLTIHEVLVKHNTNLKEALVSLRGYNKYQTQQRIKELKKWKRALKVGKYIYKQHGKYIIRKWYKGKERSFGTYERLEDAKTVRDYMMEHGWDLENLDKILNELNIARSNNRGVKE